MRSSKSIVILALVSVCGTASVARASICFGLGANGNILRFDTATSAPPATLPSSVPDTFLSGLAIDEQGVGWAINWNGRLHSVNMTTGSGQLATTLPRPGNGWYKDLAWDWANSRLLGLWFGTDSGSFVSRPTIGVIDPAAGTFTSIGSAQITSGHFTGLAVSMTGVISILDGAGRRVHDLTSLPGNVFQATSRPTFGAVPGGAFEGLDVDPATQDLFESSPIGRISPLGEYQVIRSDIVGIVDLAFYPPGVPAPGAAVGLGFGAALAAGRRRR